MRLRDPLTKVARLFVPGGGVERDEDPAATAEREAREETGYEVAIESASGLVAHYAFTWEGVEWACETTFFRGRLRRPGEAPAAVVDATYHEGVVWLPVGEVRKELAFDAAICAAVERLL